MKNAFVLSSLILTAGYPVAVAAETIGLISFPLPNLPAVLGAYAAVGVLAFAFRDYSRHSTNDARPAAAAAPQSGIRPTLRAWSLTNPTIHAN